MGESVVIGVETHSKSARCDQGERDSGARIRMLGPLEISRAGVVLELPASRKLRGLLAYLALTPRPVPRTRLCELFWEAPADPRGELRWSLSKLRRLLDDPSRRRVLAGRETVGLDLADCAVDALDVTAAAQQGVDRLELERLRALCAVFAGDLLEGLALDDCPQFGVWLLAERHRFRARHAALLEQLVAGLPSAAEEVFGHLEKWLELAPFDGRAHERLLDALALHGRFAEAEEHLDATARLFDAEGLDAAPFREAWRRARRRHDAALGGAVAAAGPAPSAAGVAGPDEPGTGAGLAARRASVAVMPFADLDATSPPSSVAVGLTEDLITRLAKLRSPFVIARGSVFALAQRGVGVEEAGRALNVDYVVGGSVRRRGDRLVVTVDLVEPRSARILWADAFEQPVTDLFRVLEDVSNRIVAGIAREIELAERNRALLKPPSCLDAWEAYHRGLWHMYRFTRSENAAAGRLFERAVRLDPTFSRAYAGLSFTHWQNAFQGWAGRGTELERAFETAGRSLIADEQDPSAHWAMGRALWLRGADGDAIVELEKTVELSPNFALGHYMLSFVHGQSGDPEAAIEFSDYSRRLSPLDPLLFAMLGTRAMALARLGRFDEAADWAARAASRPNAHPHILGIAVHCLGLAGRIDAAHRTLADLRRTLPGYGTEDFLRTFRFEADAEALFREAARRVGLGSGGGA